MGYKTEDKENTALRNIIQTEMQMYNSLYKKIDGADGETAGDNLIVVDIYTALNTAELFTEKINLEKIQNMELGSLFTEHEDIKYFTIIKGKCRGIIICEIERLRKEIMRIEETEQDMTV